MIAIKTQQEVEILRENNLLVSATLAEVGKAIRAGIETRELDALAEAFIRSHGAVPGFLGYNGFKHTLCISVNEEVVHGLPSARKLVEGDIVSVDCGTILKGFYGDSAFTFTVGQVDQTKQKLLAATRLALTKGVEKARAGNRVGDISAAVQAAAEGAGFTVVRDLVGHGLGRQMHEEPEVPNFGTKGRGPELKAGMVICVEPMINAGTRHVVFEKDGWTVRTRDRKPAAHFEWAVAIREEGMPADILTDFGIIENALKPQANG